MFEFELLLFVELVEFEFPLPEELLELELLLPEELLALEFPLLVELLELELLLPEELFELEFPLFDELPELEPPSLIIFEKSCIIFAISGLPEENTPETALSMLELIIAFVGQ